MVTRSRRRKKRPKNAFVVEALTQKMLVIDQLQGGLVKLLQGGRG